MNASKRRQKRFTLKGGGRHTKDKGYFIISKHGKPRRFQCSHGVNRKPISAGRINGNHGGLFSLIF